MDLLSEAMLEGKQPVAVYNSTLSGKVVFEGNARILKVYQGDRQGVHASVEFADEPGRRFDRWVFGSHQNQ